MQSFQKVLWETIIEDRREQGSVRPFVSPIGNMFEIEHLGSLSDVFRHQSNHGVLANLHYVGIIRDAVDPVIECFDVWFAIIWLRMLHFDILIPFIWTTAWAMSSTISMSPTSMRIGSWI